MNIYGKYGDLLESDAPEKKCHAWDKRNLFHVNTSKTPFTKIIAFWAKGTQCLNTYMRSLSFVFFAQINSCSALVSNVYQIENVVDLQ